jgi:hypothetical protein
MPRFAWLTDLHLNFLRVGELDRFLRLLRETECEGLLITGDIGEAHDLVAWLDWLDRAIDRPIWFVLGNHDFYRGSIDEVRRQVNAFCRDRPNLHYLSASGPLELAPNVGIVGHDGWADGRLGDFQRSLVRMADFELIDELVSAGSEGRWPLLKSLADAAAAHVRRVLPQALERYPRVLLLTHVPPYLQACWHEGRISDDQWAPHFTSKAMGDAIADVMRAWPQRRLTVLCGHTHGRGEYCPAENVEVLTGGAIYGQPGVERVLEL